MVVIDVLQTKFVVLLSLLLTVWASKVIILCVRDVVCIGRTDEEQIVSCVQRSLLLCNNG